MPAVSQAQRAYLNAKFGHDWVKRHHFDNKGKLPAHVAGSTSAKKPRKKRAGPRTKKKGTTTTVTYGEY